MHFSTILPLAVIAAAAGSFAVARPVDSLAFAARDGHDLLEHAPQLLGLVAREPDALALGARAFDEDEASLSAREEYVHSELISRALLADALFTRTYLEARALEQPRREHYRTYEEYERAFLEWNRRMRGMDHAFRKTLDRNEAQYQRHQPHASGSGGGSGGGARARKPSAWAKVKSALGMGKKSRKGGGH